MNYENRSIDVDGHNFPNLALMRISAYHKSIGTEVIFFLEKIKDGITTHLIRKGFFDGEHGKALLEIRHNICEKIEECSE